MVDLHQRCFLLTWSTTPSRRLASATVERGRKIVNFYARLVLILLTLWTLLALAAESRYRIDVVGLECPVCAASLERRLGSIDGVATVQANIEVGAVFVTMKDGATLDPAKVHEVVTAAGFTMKTFGTT